ncbi:MAG: phage portal protein [Gemmataceae bacterium]
MRLLLAKTCWRLARWLSPKASPLLLGGNVWPGSSFVDAFQRIRQPTASELLAELKNTAWTCASINASVCASFPPKLYVATFLGQERPKCLTKALPAGTEHSLRNAPHLTPYTKGSVTIEEVVEHPLLTLLRQVNPVHNAFDLWELTTLYQEVLGSAYWYLRMGALGIPEQIWIVPAQHITPWRERGSPRLVDYYLYRVGGQQQRLASEEVIHFRYPDPRDPYAAGFSPLRAAFEQVASTSTYQAVKQAIYANQAVPSAVISPTEPISPEERDRLEEQWNVKFRQGGSGKALVAESGLKVDILKQSMGDLAALAEYAATKEDVANAFHIPLAYLTKDTNLANLQASCQQHMMLAIRPRLRRRDEKLNERLVPLYDPSGRLFLASEDPVSESQEQILKQQEIDLRLGVKTINEVRQERGLPPVAWGNVPWLPLNWKPTDNHRSEQLISVEKPD